MLFPEYESFDALGLAALIQKGIVSPKEVLTAAIERIEARNPLLNAVIYKNYEKALALAESGLKSIPAGPFQGVPFLLKDLLADCQDMPLMSGSRLTRHRISQADAEPVRRIKQAGCIILGKTATPEFGLSPVTESLLHGATRNPWNTDLTPGGSSGGSAVAVAARMVPMAHAGDGAGSIRIPSAFCGTFGLKISRGRAPASSLVIRIWQDMIVEHVMTRSVRDSAAMLDVLAGPESGDFASLPAPATSYLAGLQKPLAPLKIAVSHTPAFSNGTVCASYQQALADTAKLCSELGHTLEEATPPLPNQTVVEAFLIIMAAETAASIDMLTKAMGIKVRHAELETFTDLLYSVSTQFTAKDFAEAVHTLESSARQLAKFFARFDMLLTPTQLGPPPRIGALIPKGREKLLLDILRHCPSRHLFHTLLQKTADRYFSLMPFTPLANISGQPAMSVPLHQDAQGLPIGMHFMGQMGDEYRLLQLAAQLENVKPWGARQPSMLSD